MRAFLSEVLGCLGGKKALNKIELFLQGTGGLYLSVSSRGVVPLPCMHTVSLILEINLAHCQYRLVAVQINIGEFNPPELAVIHNNSEVNIRLDMNAKLLKAFVLRRQLIKSLGSDMKMSKQITPVCLVSLFSCRLI